MDKVEMLGRPDYKYIDEFYTKEHSLKAMDVYAKSQSLLFAEYCEKHGWHHNLDNHLWWNEDTPILRTHDKLYNQFLEHQSNLV